MKKLFIYLVASVSLCSSLASCEDMLDEQSYGKPTSEELLSNEENMIMLVGQAYAEIKWLHDHWGYWGINTLSSDEAMCPVRNPGNDWNDDGYWKGFNDHTWTPNDKSFENVWNYSSAGAVLCNKILKQLEAFDGIIDDDLYNRYRAELIAVRSYYYYTLFDCFGNIPYMEDYPSDPDKAKEVVPQSKPWVVWGKLVNALEENAQYLPLANVPSKAANYGRATQGLAYALLARLYLNAESYGVTPQNCGVEGINSVTDFYTRCVEACDKIISSGVYHIEPDFFTNFKVKNENSEENIFVIVENGSSSFDFQEVAGSMMNKLRITMLTLNYTHQQAWGLIEKPWNGFCARPSFIARYEYGVDRRGPCDSIMGTKTDFDVEPWGWFIGPVFAENGKDTLKMPDKSMEKAPVLDEHGNPVDKDKNGKPDSVAVPLPAVITTNVVSLDDATPNDGARLLKYQVEKNSQVNKYCENDFVLFRYADVLYMKAEAIWRGGEGDLNALLADADFQLIRTRAGLPVYSVLDENELLDERGREFAWEGIRRRDLIRFGKFNDSDYVQYVTAKDEYRNWFPIPRKMLETSGGVWKQNAGY
ncbi:MAG: RagB/SusD family nutrient uptake outer membrane protein [Bacteroidetes bacterium]|uniref:RagB/SusD family nutrient uptake outer membrane protein n=1 Tax=Candidatus Gallipaludibacter merdavium TaxID=2840839 RepID=A0A9D9HUC1_9BACT|nr:RagB/SusD family nutrient uptake outer membrane protein [Candidatus Gallipaludibacter merdavium]